jgi:hypothetical protein
LKYDFGLVTLPPAAIRLPKGTRPGAEERMRRVICGVVAGLTLGVVLAPAAAGGVPTNPNCFGLSAAQFGEAGIMGEHSSSFDSPRLGIGNVAYLVTGTHQPGLFARALGGVCA